MSLLANELRIWRKGERFLDVFGHEHEVHKYGYLQTPRAFLAETLPVLSIITTRGLFFILAICGELKPINDDTSK